VSHAHFSFAEIFRWGGSSSGFSLILAAPGDKKGQSFEWVVVTSQAQDMAAIILDHIRALMKK